MNMTALAYSTDSTIERPRPPDPELRRPNFAAPATLARPSVAAIVTSLHGRTGKTLLARVLADYFVLSGRRPLIFDTDAAERTLHASFPYDTVVADLGEVRDQMNLFDTLAVRSPEARVVDVSHFVFRKFFRVMQDSDIGTEARLRSIEPIIFYIADRNPDTYEEGRLLRERFEEFAFVLVENAHIGGVKELTRRSAGYQALESHDLRMSVPLLDPAIVEAIDNPRLSLSDLMRQPLSRGDDEQRAPGDLGFDERAMCRSWLGAVFREIHRVTRQIEMRAAPILSADTLI